MIPWLGERELRITFPDWVEPHPHSSHLGAILGSAQRACAQSAPAGAGHQPLPLPTRTPTTAA